MTTNLTISQINSIITEYRLKRDKVQQELDTIDSMISHWVTQRETLRQEIEGTEVSLFDQMFGGDPVNEIPSIHKD